MGQQEVTKILENLNAYTTVKELATLAGIRTCNATLLCKKLLKYDEVEKRVIVLKVGRARRPVTMYKIK